MVLAPTVAVSGRTLGSQHGGCNETVGRWVRVLKRGLPIYEGGEAAPARIVFIFYADVEK